MIRPYTALIVLHLKRLYWWALDTFYRPLVRARRLKRDLGMTPTSWNQLRSESAGAATLRVKELPHPIFLRHGSSDFDVFQDVFLDGAYSAPVVAPVRTIVDCGANVGLASLYFLRRYRSARIVAIEPDPGNVIVAKENLAPYSDRVTLLEAAVWPSSGTVGLRRGAYRDGRSWATQVTDDRTGASTRAVTVDEIMTTEAIDEIDILKIDIEGAERALFEGDTTFLEKTRCVLIELHDDDDPGCSVAFCRAVTQRGFIVRSQNLTFIATRTKPINSPAARAPRS